jgi:hypothetical protein
MTSVIPVDALTRSRLASPTIGGLRVRRTNLCLRCVSGLAASHDPAQRFGPSALLADRSSGPHTATGPRLGILGVLTVGGCDLGSSQRFSAILVAER